MKIYSVTVKKENLKEDLNFLKEMLALQNSLEDFDFIQVCHFTPRLIISFRKVINKFVQIKRKKAGLAIEKTLIIISSLPAPVWLKKIPRLNKQLINGKLLHNFVLMQKQS